MRPQQWIKNLFIFAALTFSANLFNFQDLVITIMGFILYSLSASGIYIINDIADLGRDKYHPLKSLRPLPSGFLTKKTAYYAAFFLLTAGIAGSYFLNRNFSVIVLIYVVINFIYSVKLKDIVILDVMTIAAGFVLRVVSGAVLIGVPTSEWLIICTVLLSLFLGFSKRRHELIFLEKQAMGHRSVLRDYSPVFLDQMISIVTATTVMSYALYTISEETVHKFGTTHLIYTVPFVLYGIFRYLYLVHKEEQGGNPARLALTDFPLLVNIILWFISVTMIIYLKQI